MISASQSKQFNYLLTQELHHQDSINSSATGSLQAQQAAAQRYKTELCRSYQENGTCKYGEKCQFAHGYHELRSMMRHPKYKSELCRTFHAQGYCPYGPRCHFVHEIQPDNLTKHAKNNNQTWININTKVASPWDNSQPGSKTGSPKNSGLLMCALSGSSSSLFSDFSDWSMGKQQRSSSGSSSGSSLHELSPTSSRSLSPDGSDSPHMIHHQMYDDVDLSTTMLVNQILNTINDNKVLW